MKERGTMQSNRKENDSFYIHDIDRERGTCAITFILNVKTYQNETGAEYDFDECTLLALWHDELAEDIRRNYQAWASHALSYEHLRATIQSGVDAYLHGLVSEHVRLAGVPAYEEEGEVN
jgi:hypothetical protein